MMKIILGLMSFVIISSFMMSTSVFSQQIDLESSSLVLQSGIISTKNNDYLISNDLDIRHFFDGKIVRISGTTIDGKFYYVYHKNLEGEISSFGKIFVENEFIPLIFTKISSESEITSKIVSVEPQIDLLILAKIDRTSYWEDTVDMTIRVYDSSKNQFGDFYYNTGWLDDVDIKITITHENGEQLATLNGKTGPFGYFEGNYLVRQPTDQTGIIAIQVKADYQESTATETFEAIIFGTTKSPGN